MILLNAKKREIEMKILIVEDEKKVASFIKRGLEDANYQVTLSYDGADGLKRASSGEFDLIDAL